MSKGLVLVTGAGGYFGGILARTLKERGYGVRLFLHNNIPDFPIDDYEVFYGDICNPDDVRHSVKGTIAIFHTAGYVKTKARDKTTFDMVNEGGLRNVVGAGDSNSIPIYYTSSFIALNPSDGSPRREGDAITPNTGHNDYERSKRNALVYARSMVNAGSPLVILLPGVIYGPGKLTSGNLIGRIIIDRARGRDPLMPRFADRRWSFSYIYDVVDGHINAFERGITTGEFILGGDNKSLGEFFDILERVSGIKKPGMWVPFFIAKVKAGFWDETIIFGLSGQEPKITRGVLEIYKHSWEVSSDKAISELGYKITPLEDGLKSMVMWMKGEGLI
ncbi:MAG: NAD-dependent epimerase/dehydratase family protein [bacterium]